MRPYESPEMPAPEAGQRIQAFYDGGCPLCYREIELLKRWDRQRQIQFIDIDSPSFVAADYGKTQSELMAHMHARLADGQWVSGVEVFRQLYSIVGFGVPVWFSRLPGISLLLRGAYSVFARLRLKLPRRRCDSDSCPVD